MAHFSNGQQIQYDALISTAPLDLTLTWLGQKSVADRLEHRSAGILSRNSFFLRYLAAYVSYHCSIAR